MNYCGNPLSNHYIDTRFLDTFETVNTAPIDVGNVEKNYKYNPDNDVDISLGIRQNTEQKELNQSIIKYYWQKMWK